MIKNIPYIEKYVEDLKVSTDILVSAFGFKLVGETTHSNGNHSNILEEGNIRIILTSGRAASEQVKIHGDFIKDVAFEVDDIKSVYEKAMKAGFKPILEPMKEGDVQLAQISTFGNSIHTLIQTNMQENPKNNGNFDSIDHIAIAVDDLKYWTDLYENGLGLEKFSEETIETDKTGMYSKVLSSKDNEVTLFFAASKESSIESQIDLFLKENAGSGIQHIALSTKDIITTIEVLKTNNMKFVSPPKDYYKNLPESLKKKFEDDFDIIRELDIFIDQDYNGEMMQIFTQPIQSRNTFFFEIIQRDNAISFGKNNVLALFKALEQKFENG